MIDVRFTITEADYIEMQVLNARETKYQMIRETRYTAGFGLFALTAGLLALLWRWFAHLSVDHRIIWGCSAGDLALLWYLYDSLTFRTVKNRLKSSFPRLKPASLERHLRIDKFGFRREIATEKLMRWDAFTMWMESESMFLLLEGKTFFPVLKRTLSAVQTDELRSIIEAYVPPAKHVRPQR